jgi:DNA-binding response OmpR family regulator
MLPEEGERHMTARKVLIVEDDQDLVRALSVRFRSQGFAVSAAYDAFSAVPVARREQPDVILLDLGLPAGDGFVVMDRLRNIPSLAGIPVVILTARDPETARQRAMVAGASAFLRKPVDHALLFNVIRFVLDEPGAQAPESGILPPDREAAGGA